jgi:hypothetical protein
LGFLFSKLDFVDLAPRFGLAWKHWVLLILMQSFTQILLGLGGWIGLGWLDSSGEGGG